MAEDQEAQPGSLQELFEREREEEASRKAEERRQVYPKPYTLKPGVLKPFTLNPGLP